MRVSIDFIGVSGEDPRVPGSVPGQGTIFLLIETKKPTSDYGLFSF